MVNDQRFVGVSNFYPTTFEKADATALKHPQISHVYVNDTYRQTFGDGELEPQSTGHEGKSRSTTLRFS